MHRIFLQEDSDILLLKNYFFLDKQKYKNEFHHLKNVLRTKKNETVHLLASDQKVIEATLSSYSEDGAYFSELKAIDENNELRLKLEVCAAFLKQDKFDSILPALVQLGMTEFTPVLTDNCQFAHELVKNQTKLDKKIQRWQEIIRHASVQARRNKIPLINQPLTFEDFCQRVKNNKSDSAGERILFFICHENYKDLSLYKYLLTNLYSQRDPDVLQYDKIVFLIGPEGGFSDKETSLMEANNITQLSLGKRILRAETASLAVCALISSLLA